MGSLGKALAKYYLMKNLLSFRCKTQKQNIMHLRDFKHNYSISTIMQRVREIEEATDNNVGLLFHPTVEEALDFIEKYEEQLTKSVNN